MALSRVGGSSVATTSVAIPAHQAGDLIIIWAFRDGSTTPPTVPAAAGTVPAFTTVDGPTGANTCSAVCAWAVAAGTTDTSGTWTNATGLSVEVWRGAAASPIGGHAQSGASVASGANIAIPSITLGDPTGTSAILAFAGHQNVTAWSAAPAGYTQRSQVSTEVEALTKDTTTSDGAFNVTCTASGTGGTRTQQLEIVAGLGNRVSQEAVEVLESNPNANARVSQEAVEVLLKPPSGFSRVSQVAVETLRATYFSASKSQTATARIRIVTGTKAQTALARVRATVTKSQTATARVNNTAVTKAQTAKARISVATESKAQTAKARISKTLTKAQTAKARVQNSVSKVQTAVARISNTHTAAQTSTARVSATVTKAQTAVARIASAGFTGTKTQTSVARVQKVGRTKTQTSRAYIATGSVTLTASGELQLGSDFDGDTGLTLFVPESGVINTASDGTTAYISITQPSSAALILLGDAPTIPAGGAALGSAQILLGADPPINGVAGVAFPNSGIIALASGDVLTGGPTQPSSGAILLVGGSAVVVYPTAIKSGQIVVKSDPAYVPLVTIGASAVIRLLADDATLGFAQTATSGIIILAAGHPTVTPLTGPTNPPGGSGTISVRATV